MECQYQCILCNIMIEWMENDIEMKQFNFLHILTFDKSPALPGWFIWPVLIVSFCFVGDNIFGTGVCWDHHLHPIQGNKIFSFKTRKSFLRKLGNPVRAELQILWKKILANPALGALLCTERCCHRLLQIEITDHQIHHTKLFERCQKM